MIKTYYKKPYPHLVIDDFFPKHIWDYISKNINNDEHWEYSYKKPVFSIKPHARKSSIYDFEPNGGYEFDNIRDDIIVPYLDKFWEEEDIFNTLAKSDRTHTRGLKHVVDLKFTTSPQTLNVHEEGEGKVATAIIYLHPSHDTGTLLYEHQYIFSKPVIWKPNRACVMVHNKGCWHGYASFDSNKRVTINSHLIRCLDDVLEDVPNFKPDSQYKNYWE